MVDIGIEFDNPHAVFIPGYEVRRHSSIMLHFLITDTENDRYQMPSQ